MDGGGGRRYGSDSPYTEPERKKVEVDVSVNVSAKEKKELPVETTVRGSSDSALIYKAKEVVIDGVVVKSRFFPIGMGVLVVPQPEDRLARCQHNNFAGECLVCYRLDKGSNP